MFFTHIKLKDIPIENRPSWMSEDTVKKNENYIESWCKLIKSDIDDQCKSCGIKFEF